MKKVVQKAIYSGAILSLMLPVVSFAAFLFNEPGDQTQSRYIGPGTDIGAVYGTLDLVSSYFLGVLIAVAVIFIIYGAFLFLASGGDVAKTKKARDYILYALVAAAIGLVAKGLVMAIRGIARTL